MEVRPVGRTGLEVSLLGFGAAPLANLYRDVPESEAYETVHAALEQGVTYFDTAPAYGAGVSETRLGVALAGVPRDQYTISTKVGRWFGPDGDRVTDYSRDGVLRSLEDSLERLKLDYVDIVHIHDADHHYREAIEDAYPTLAELRSQAVIRAVSAGMNQWQMLLDFANAGEFDCFMLAGRYTLLEQGALGFMDMCAERGSPFWRQAFTTAASLPPAPDPTPSTTIERRRLRSLKRRKRWKPSAPDSAWRCRRRPCSSLWAIPPSHRW